MAPNDDIHQFRKRLTQEKQALLNQSSKQREVKPSPKAPLSRGLDVVIHMMASLFVGGLIGFGFDKLLGTWPLLCISFSFLGIIAGVVSLYKSL